VTRGYAGGEFQVKTAPNGPVLASIKLQNTNLWHARTAEIDLPQGKQALYLTYVGGGNPMLKSVIFDWAGKDGVYEEG